MKAGKRAADGKGSPDKRRKTTPAASEEATAAVLDGLLAAAAAPVPDEADEEANQGDAAAGSPSGSKTVSQYSPVDAEKFLHVPA